jgi:hypothetical protein
MRRDLPAELELDCTARLEARNVLLQARDERRAGVIHGKTAANLDANVIAITIHAEFRAVIAHWTIGLGHYEELQVLLQRSIEWVSHPVHMGSKSAPLYSSRRSPPGLKRLVKL